MGHRYYLYLPKTQNWNNIVDQIGDFADGEISAGEIAKNALSEVQKKYNNLQYDTSIKSSFEFLVQLGFAFKTKDPIGYLKENNILEGDELTHYNIARAAKDYKSQNALSNENFSFGAQAAVDAINTWYKNNLDKGQSLFSPEIDNKAILSRAAKAEGFSELSRLYFSKLTERYLKYFLEREASVVITNINDRERFSKDIENHVQSISKHAFETAKITQSFGAGWFNNYVKDKLPNNYRIKGFLNIAFGKMKAELLREEKK